MKFAERRENFTKGQDEMMKYSRKAAAVILSLIMIMTMMPAMAFAEDTNGNDTDGTFSMEAISKEIVPVSIPEAVAEDADDSGLNQGAALDEETSPGDEEDCDGIELGCEVVSGNAGFDTNDEAADPDKLLDEFMLSSEGSIAKRMTPEAPMSIKGDRLTGKALNLYNAYKSIIKAVNKGKKNSTLKKISTTKVIKKRTYTARELGLSKIANIKGGKWVATKKAKEKIANMVAKQTNWKRVYQSLLSDLSSESYWVAWSSNSSFYTYTYRYDRNKVYFTKKITLSLPVMPEYAKAVNPLKINIYKLDRSKLNATSTARENARAIVQIFDEAIPIAFEGYTAEQIDYNRLWYYCNMICRLADYDREIYERRNEQQYWQGAWSMIYVFDNDMSTKVVCTGYARALKYLCELSNFNSDWIDCQLATGYAGENHMWCTVRMNDGENYLVDPTWMDQGDSVDSQWFLRGDPYGTSNSFTVEGVTRVYDAWYKKAFDPAERILSKNSYYTGGTDRLIDLYETKISKLTKDKKAFTVKWKKVSKATGALYVDGYQIQYSTNKNFSKPKTVTVKGYKQSSKSIKRLKSKKTYYVRIRTYANMGKGRYYSDWSPRRKVKTK